jgi:hypothetical protein
MTETCHVERSDAQRLAPLNVTSSEQERIPWLRSGQILRREIS